MSALTVALVVALIVALGVSATLVGMLYWQMKRADDATHQIISAVKQLGDKDILLAASETALSDKDRALTRVVAERDRLEFTVDTVEDQRNALLKEAMDRATPGTIAIAVRDALRRMRTIPPELSDKDMPSG